MKEFEALGVNTKTNAAHVVINGKRNRIMKVNDKYCFISTKRILDKFKYLSCLGQKPKYANIFNELGQELIKEYLNN